MNGINSTPNAIWGYRPQSDLNLQMCKMDVFNEKKVITK